jgi:hypothetical protein
VSVTLKLIREGVGMELRRGTFDVLVDGKRVGSIELASPESNLARVSDPRRGPSRILAQPRPTPGPCNR